MTQKEHNKLYGARCSLDGKMTIKEASLEFFSNLALYKNCMFFIKDSSKELFFSFFYCIIQKKAFS